MWCILRCHSGYENEVIQSCRQSLAGQGFSDVFTFTYDRMKRYQGAWHLERDVMFPGCVFLERDNDDMDRECMTELWSEGGSSARFGLLDVQRRSDELGSDYNNGRKAGGVDENRAVYTDEFKSGRIGENRAINTDEFGGSTGYEKYEWNRFIEKICDAELVALEKEAILRRLCGEEHHLPMSEGYIRDGVTYVTSGPLVGMERFIRRIDRHKRTARVEIPTGMIYSAGLEIISKS